MENCEGKIDGGLLETIRKLNQQGYNDGNIADLLGIPIWTVTRRRRMGLPRNSLNTDMTMKKRIRTARASLRINTGERMNYRTMAHELKAMGFGWPDYKMGEALILKVLELDGNIPMTANEILERVNYEKQKRDLRPEMTRGMFFHYIARLKKGGLVRRLYGTGEDWRRQPRIYELTEYAYSRARDLRRKLCVG